MTDWIYSNIKLELHSVWEIPVLTRSIKLDTTFGIKFNYV